MLHVWLVPLAALAVMAMAGFYLLIRFKGGSGIRTEGKIVEHRDFPEEDLPPA